MTDRIHTAGRVRDVRYEIRGELARRARELEQAGHEIVHLDIGNPGAFGFRTPETMRRAMVRNLHHSEAYGRQLGIFTDEIYDCIEHELDDPGS